MMQYLVIRSVIAIVLALSVHFIVQAVEDNTGDKCKAIDQTECVQCSNCIDIPDRNDTLEYHVCQACHSCNNFVNISANLTLSSVLSLSYNFTISGHNRPTVNCINGGGLHLCSCHNCTIKGIHWIGCGNSSIAGLEFYNSSNVTIHNCTFQQSVGQAIVLSKVSGDIQISHCNFVNNSQYKGHGSAIHYSPAIDTAYCKLTINNCNFTHNKGDMSIVHVEGSSYTLQRDCSLSDSRFLQNTGIPFYISSQNLSIYGNVVFKENVANKGGGLFICNYSNITFDQNSVIEFSQNDARSGGAIFIKDYSNVLFRGNSQITFSNNRANFSGGAIHSSDNSSVTFNGSSVVSFKYNQAKEFGGAIASVVNSEIVHKGNSTVRFDNNKALHAGAVYSDTNSHVRFAESSEGKFVSNEADLIGGALYFNNTSSGTFEDDTTVTFCNNKATINGGASYSNSSSSVTFKGKASVSFNGNTATLGAGICFDNHSRVLFSEKSVVTFYGNIATVNGGAIHLLVNSNVTFAPNSAINFTNNRAQYGACLFRDTTEGIISFTNGTNITFQNNYAKITGKSIYIDVPKSCNAKCLEHRILGLKNNSDVFAERIATPPTKLELRQPAQCLDNSKTECLNYYLKNIMLGQEVEVNSCIQDYYNNEADTTQFLVSGDTQNQNYSIEVVSNHVLISCGTFRDIRIVGTKDKDLPEPLNYTINISLDVDHNSDWKPISVNLTVKLTPCHAHPGFLYSHDRCQCYNSSSKTVFCSGSSSTINRGYWFGFVASKPTVTYCPITYCNFSCCETNMKGIYHLSPMRANQCRLHRTGTACGSCMEGYTLPFDSSECVRTSSCTPEHLVLILTLTVIYWISIVAAVFAMMYYKVGLGYLYVITHYYSIVDIILFQKFYDSNGLHTTVTVTSSIVKIIPQFLGQLCLTENMSGIDQQFIHYVHPLAMSLILVAISVLARSSKRVSLLISRGIIHVICFLLLLSYTSVVNTSLLLMKPMTFEGVDKIYTYVSPDIVYFSGRHLFYGIVAFLCLIIIAIALPLLLLLEPFLNHKINFIKIKPLLDQFQGCYRDKYRYFAAFYMICRLIIILITAAENLFGGSFALQYLLITVCVLMAVIHLIVRPYSDAILNAFDGLVLQLIILVAALCLIEFYNDLVVITAFILVILPSLFLLLLLLVIYKEKIQNTLKSVLNFKKECAPSAPDVERPRYCYFDTIIDDSMRKSTTVCDV